MLLGNKSLFKNIAVMFCILFFLVLSIWWILIYRQGLHEGPQNDAFTLIYPLMSLIGGIIGIVVSSRWGGLKSYFGSAIMFLSFGLLAQFFGQASYAFLIYVESIAVPYPSIGDIGYFGSIFFYIIALIYLGKVIGVKKNLISFHQQFLAFFIPIVLLLGSYFLFLQGYEFDWSNKLRIFLDFGYPIGQAIYVSLAIVILILSRNVLGGIMRKPIWFLIFALVFQYFSDSMFLYQAGNETWYVGGINDYLYFISYFIMTISLIQFGSAFYKIKNT